MAARASWQRASSHKLGMNRWNRSLTAFWFTASFEPVERRLTRNLSFNSITRTQSAGSIAPMFPAALEQPESLIGNRVLLPSDAGKT